MKSGKKGNGLLFHRPGRGGEDHHWRTVLSAPESAAAGGGSSGWRPDAGSRRAQFSRYRSCPYRGPVYHRGPAGRGVCALPVLPRPGGGGTGCRGVQHLHVFRRSAVEPGKYRELPGDLCQSYPGDPLPPGPEEAVFLRGEKRGRSRPAL